MQVQPGQRKNPPGPKKLSQWPSNSSWDDSWGQGIATGSGWSDSESPTRQSNSQEIGIWINNSRRCYEAASKAASNGGSDKVVDVQDKQLWPSIIDQSESASDGCDTDNASVRSGSVISSSGAPVVSAGTVWGTDSDNLGSWGANVAGGWSGTPAASDVNNRQPFMQISRSDSSGVLGGAGSVAVSNTQKGWPVSATDMAESAEAMVNARQGKQQQGSSSAQLGWSNTGASSAGNSVIGSSSDVVVVSASDPNKTSTTTTPVATVPGSPSERWTQSSDDDRDSMSNGGGSSNGGKAEGWGRPAPAPLPNAGTEGWGQTGVSTEWLQQQQQQQQQTSRALMSWPSQTAVTDSRAGGAGWSADNQSSGWRHPDAPPPPPPTASGWNQPSAPTTANLGPSPPTWGVSEKPPTPAWNPQQQQQQPPPPPPSGQSHWLTQQPAPASASQMSSGWSIASNRPAPVSMPPPSAVPPVAAAAPHQMPASSSTWAQAAGRGLPPLPPTPTNRPPPSSGRITADDIITQAVNSNDGWGRTRIRQDASWDVDARNRPNPATHQANSSSAADDSASHWHQPNNGTAIWEASKGEQAAAAAAGGAGGRLGENPVPPAVSDFSNDSDAGTWNGPPPPSQPPPPPANWQGNQWSMNAPPPPVTIPPSNWGGGGGGGGGSSSSSSGSWDGGKRGARNWTDKKEEAMWERRGTWNEGGDGKPGWQSGRSSSTSSWHEDDHTTSWTGGQSEAAAAAAVTDADDNAAYWPEQTQHRPRSWNGPPMDHMKMDEKGGPPWNQPPPPHRPISWGDHASSRQPNSDMFFNQNMAQPMQQKPANWGDASWQVKQANRGPWGDGHDHWNAVNANRRYPFPGNTTVRPNTLLMRSMLQHLMDKGFKKDDAQTALIKNDLNWENSLAELLAHRAEREMCELPKGRLLRGAGGDSLHPVADSSHALASMPNTLFSSNSSAQSQFINPQVLVNSLRQQQQHQQHQQASTSLQTPSSLIAAAGLGSAANSINSSTAALQQKLLQQHLKQQQQQQQQQQPAATSQGQANRTAGSAAAAAAPQAMQQQLLQAQQQQQQQQIVQQLQIAVRAGLISPQLLNQQMTPTMLVQLQQLLQLQKLLQQLQTNQLGAPSQRQVDSTIQQVRERIAQTQQQIVQAQLQQQQQSLAAAAAAAKQATPLAAASQQFADQQQQVQQMKDLLSELPSDLEQVKDTPVSARADSGGAPQSRMNKWKLPSPEKDASSDGSKSMKPAIQLSHSTPNLQSQFETTLPYSDHKWSSKLINSSAWPTTTTAASVDSLSASMMTPSSESDDEAGSESGLDIVEFVPGKPWQGMDTRSTDDDPYLTPGSVARSISVNNVKDDFACLGLTSKFDANPASLELSAPGDWSSFGVRTNRTKSSSSAWQQPEGGSELWGGVKGRPPPGLPPSNTANKVPAGVTGGGGGWQQPAFNRSASWTPGERPTSFNTIGGNNGAGGPVASCSLVLKNLTPQVDGHMLQTLCRQHGPLRHFQLNQGVALVRYESQENTAKAKAGLHNCVLGNTTILAEFISDADLERQLSRSGSAAMSGLWTQPSAATTGGGGFRTPPSFNPTVSEPPPQTGASDGGGAQWNGASQISGSMWGGDSLWSPTMEDSQAL